MAELGCSIPMSTSDDWSRQFLTNCPFSAMNSGVFTKGNINRDIQGNIRCNIKESMRRDRLHSWLDDFHCHSHIPIQRSHSGTISTPVMTLIIIRISPNVWYNFEVQPFHPYQAYLLRFLISLISASVTSYNGIFPTSSCYSLNLQDTFHNLSKTFQSCECWYRLLSYNLTYMCVEKKYKGTFETLQDNLVVTGENENTLLYLFAISLYTARSHHTAPLLNKELGVLIRFFIFLLFSP
jgi:hypothetical protein